METFTTINFPGCIKNADEMHLMPVTMMYVRHVRMAVYRGVVPVRMGMRFAAIPIEVMTMPMMLVMDMFMGVRHGFVRMKVRMALCQMQPDSRSHQHAGCPKPRARRIAQQ